jgi:hypothetical protein
LRLNTGADREPPRRRVEDVVGQTKLVHHGLSHFSWTHEKGAATAAILVLFALAIISNRVQRMNGLRTNDLVRATYDQIREVAPLSRKLLARAIELLRAVEAIRVERLKNANTDALIGLGEPGKFCLLPQQHLCNRFDHMQRLNHFFEHIKKRGSLHALKLYMLLLSLRENTSKVARCSYERIEDYTQLRREEISTAIQLLVATGLIRLAGDDEIPRRKGEPKHNRYFILGLR